MDEPPPQPRAVSVLGPLDASVLEGGTVLPHEMLLFDQLSRQTPPSTLELQQLRDATPSLSNLAALRANPLAVSANLRSPSLDVVAEELQRLAAVAAPGPCVVVDVVPTAADGRDPASLVALARKTGVHIIMGVSRTLAAVAAAEVAAAAAAATQGGAQGDDDGASTAEQLIAQQLVDELTSGVPVPGEGGVCAGVLGELLAHPQRSAAHATLLRAAAAAQMRTGAPIWVAIPAMAAAAAAAEAAAAAVATEDGADGGDGSSMRMDTEEAAPPPPLLAGSASPGSTPGQRRASALASALAAQENAVQETLRLVVAHGGAAERLVLSHAQHLLGNPEAMRSLLRQGCTLCFDHLGCGWQLAAADAHTDPLLEPPSDGAVAAAVAALVAEGFGAQLLASSGVETALQLRAFGGGGYAHVLERWLPRLRRQLGGGEGDGQGGGGDANAHADTMRMLRGATAARLLCWRLPDAPAARLVRSWTCTSCHRTFEEPVNPAEALPTDQRYYEKLDFRYCAMQCLANHRKAKWAQPFGPTPPPSG